MPATVRLRDDYSAEALRSLAARVSLEDAGRVSDRWMRWCLAEPFLIRSSDSDGLDFDLPRRVGEPTDDECARRLAIAQHLAAPFAGGGQIAMVR
jgi:hypothetical protein